MSGMQQEETIPVQEDHFNPQTESTTEEQIVVENKPDTHRNLEATITEKMAKVSQAVPKSDVEIKRTGIETLDTILQLNLVIQILSILKGIHEQIVNRKEDTLPRIYILVLQNGQVVAFHLQRIAIISWNVSHEIMPQFMFKRVTAFEHQTVESAKALDSRLAKLIQDLVKWYESNVSEAIATRSQKFMDFVENVKPAQLYKRLPWVKQQD
ncbi:hypothetical protein TCAL_02123 [Tigriopus californicus]|uniref:Uncharacterized protein n=1 Tax=Tigriopus californicus TaxID=6832 RepID=A0A553N810_TIGCA|nr:uncharacterized protein LOC131885865 [Tigriopus californicus]TRY61571.1 hypothetical protein TCAL_02123 [Tigriopus californicus]|eukprot:TCALIF_02123-PA protein Name:"Protein of unknown function" AED:0.01 eAED:0.01 QI:0/1/0.66/1/1/1/3/164/210